MYGDISTRCRDEKTPVEWDHEESSRTYHIRHARGATTEYPSRLGDRIGSTKLVYIIRCLERDWARLGSSHTRLCTKLLQGESPDDCWIYAHDAADLLLILVMIPDPNPTWWDNW